MGILITAIARMACAVMIIAGFWLDFAFLFISGVTIVTAFQLNMYWQITDEHENQLQTMLFFNNIT